VTEPPMQAASSTSARRRVTVEARKGIRHPQVSNCGPSTARHARRLRRKPTVVVTWIQSIPLDRLAGLDPADRQNSSDAEEFSTSRNLIERSKEIIAAFCGGKFQI
jgi:hypothetical protein